MLFTWDTTNLCIVFRSWHITGTWSLIWSLIAVVLLAAAYEAIREASRRYEERLSVKLEDMPRSVAGAEDAKARIIKAILYGIQVFYSFFIMLVFMTYNGWVMLAVGFGAFLGYLMFGRSSISRSAACH
ncbi:hypothetical protein AMS68_000962 [Peltaster fructicola]|uniref:Copper transport protein n=1 Tax=Peltaster fructicola TaxID=286661 RepID=A0A6H0XLE0_9PEZI|nr:hypothetical protein AMS68_000962 [Peltaster fructicola]